MDIKKTSYNLSADVIRVLAIIGVVIIHTANAVYGRPDFFGGISWWFAIILNSISRASIPLFIMVSGYFILAKHETYKETVLRTINRIGLPLIFWFLFYTVWNFGSPTLEYIDFSLIYRLLTVNVLFLYFFIILIGLYLASPLLKRVLKAKIQKPVVTFSFLAGGCAYFLLQYLLYLCTPAYSLIYWIPFTGFFIAGFTLGKFNKYKPLFSILYISGLALTIGGSYLYYLYTFQGNNIFNSHGCLAFYADSFLSINVVMMAVGAYALLMNFEFSKIIKGRLKKLIFSIARASLGIYILHIFILDILDSKLKLFDPISPAWLYIIVKFLVIFTLAYLLTLILTRIPILKRLLGEK